MTFVQMMEYETSKPDEVRRTIAEWEQATQGKRSAKRVLSTRHHDDANRYCDIVFFDSYEQAMENSQLPETQTFARKLNELTDGELTYFDLDVMEDKSL